MSAPRRPGGDDRRPARRDRRGAGPRKGRDDQGAGGPEAVPDKPARAQRGTATGRPARAQTAVAAAGAGDRADRAPGAKPPRSAPRPPRGVGSDRPARPRPGAPAGQSVAANDAGPAPDKRAGQRRAPPTRPAAGPGPEPVAARPASDARREPQRIAKLLARAGVASRREIERMIAEGRVAINGAVLETPATIVPSLHGVTVDGKAVQAAGAARLFLFHKPPGFLTTAQDPRGRPTIYDRLPPELPRVMPVGRLDMSTEGLLLLTTDGGLKRQLELPSSGIPRLYRARAYGDVRQDQLEALAEGVTIEGVRYGPIDANMERRTGRNGWIELRLAEGKNREVRRVLEHLGLQVSRLIRVAYGPFVLADLPAGGVVEVRQNDLVAFRQTLR